MHDGLSDRLDVLVHPEKVGRVVLFLDLHKSAVRRTVSERDALVLILSKEVDVRAATGERLRLGEELACPGDAARILGGGLPASVHVHHVIGVSARISYRPGRYARRLSSDRANEDLAVRRRQLGGVFDDGGDDAIIELREVMRLPVVSRTWRQEWIEGLLPGAVWLHAYVLAVRRAEPAQRLDQLLALIGITRIAQRERDNFFAVNVVGQERQRRRLPRDHPDVELVRHRLGEMGELREHRLRLLERKDDEAAQHIRPDRMQLELEAGDNSEISTTTTQPPEDIGVFRFAGAQLAAIRRDDICGKQVVNGHAVLPAQPAESAPKRQAGHARGRVDAQRRGEAVRLCGPIEISEGATGLDGRPADIRVHLDALHQRQIDHEAVVADGIARDIVSAPSDRDDKVVLARELDSVNYIFRRRAAGNQRGLAVDHGVPDMACLVVGRVVRKKHLPSEVRFELVDICFL